MMVTNNAAATLDVKPVSPSKVPAKLVILLIVTWALLMIRLSAPWYGVQDSFRVWVASAVRNFSLYNPEIIGLMITRDAAPVEDPHDLQFYSHHPPGIVWVPALVTKVVGFHELGVRFGFVCSTMIGIAAFYVLTRRLIGEKYAWWATFFYALTPFVAYHGRVPGQDPLGMTAALLFGVVMLNWLRQPTRGRYLALLTFAGLAVWSAWPGVFIVAGFGLAGFLLGSSRQRLQMVFVGAFSALALVILMVFYQLQWSESIDSILEAFSWRSSSVFLRPNSRSFTVFEYLAVTLRFVIVLGTPTLLIFAILGALAWRRHISRRATIITGILFAAGLSYQLVFRNASFLHDFYWVFIIPPMAIAASVFVVNSKDVTSKYRLLRPLIDGLLLSFLLASAYELWLMHGYARQPMLDAIIETINVDVSSDDVLLGYVEAQGYSTFTGHDRVIEFYTFRPLEWDVLYQDALTIAQETDKPITYIYCAWEIPKELEPYPREAFLGTYCSRIRFNGEAAEQDT